MSATLSFILLFTAGGTLLTISTVQTDDLVKTMVLSAIGAFTSFVTAALLSWLFRRRKR